MLSHGGGSAGSLEQKKSELAKTPVTAPKKPAQDTKVSSLVILIIKIVNTKQKVCLNL